MILFIKKYFPHFIGLLFGAAICYYGLWKFFEDLRTIKGGSYAALGPIMMAVIGLAAAGLCAGLIFGQIGGDVAGAWFADLMLYPRKFLGKPPVLTSHAQGLIKLHEYRDAEHELQDIVRVHPDDRQAALLLGQLYLDHLRDYPAAETGAAAYLARATRRAERGDLDLVNLCVDACLEMSRPRDALRYLEIELGRSDYSDLERSVMLSRRDALQS